MMIWIAIAAGGATGAVSRYATSMAVAASMGPGWQPLATFAVNVIGSGLMGLIYGVVSTGFVPMTETSRVFIQIGFLGALTTFSSFALDAVSLVEKGQFSLAAGYVLGSVIASLAAFVIMVMAIRLITAGQ